MMFIHGEDGHGAVWSRLLTGDLHLPPPTVPTPGEDMGEYNGLRSIVVGNAEREGIPVGKVQANPLPEA